MRVIWSVERSHFTDERRQQFEITPHPNLLPEHREKRPEALESIESRPQADDAAATDRPLISICSPAGAAPIDFGRAARNEPGVLPTFAWNTAFM